MLHNSSLPKELDVSMCQGRGMLMLVVHLAGSLADLTEGIESLKTLSIEGLGSKQPQVHRMYRG